MPKYKHGSGSVYKRGKNWWLSYYVLGDVAALVAFCEASYRMRWKRRRPPIPQRPLTPLPWAFIVFTDRIATSR